MTDKTADLRKKIAEKATKLAPRLNDPAAVKAAEVKLPGAGTYFAQTRAFLPKLSDVALSLKDIKLISDQYQGLIKVFTEAGGGGDPVSDPSCTQKCRDELDACGRKIPSDASVEEQVAYALMCALTHTACIADCLLPS